MRSEGREKKTVTPLRSEWRRKKEDRRKEKKKKEGEGETDHSVRREEGEKRREGPRVNRRIASVPEAPPKIARGRSET